MDYFSSEALRSDLKRKTVRGGLYTGLAQAIQIGVQLAAIPILSRLLPPEAFGLVAMVTALSAFAGMFVDVGLSMATMQRAHITPAQVSNLFWISTLLGASVGALFAVVAPAIAWFYSEPRLQPITWAICPSFVLAGLTMQHNALLRRAMQFRSLAVIQVLAVLLGYSVAIAWAWWYQNYWALVIFPLATALVRLLGTWAACRWQPGLPRRGTGSWDMLRFGGYLTGFSLTNYFSRNADNILIGWYWGATPLGFYDRAYKLLMFPLQNINGPLTSVTVPALSRVINEPAKYRHAYLTMLESLLIVTAPLTAFVFVARDLIVRVLLGPEWSDAIPIFAWLGLGAFCQPLTHTLGWLLISQDRTREMFEWSVFASIVSVISFAVGLPWGPVAVAACYVVANALIHMPTLIYWATRSGPVRARDLLEVVGLPAGVAGVVFFGLVIFRWMHESDSDLVNLSGCVAIAALIWLVAMSLTKQGQQKLVYYWSSLVGKSKSMRS